MRAHAIALAALFVSLFSLSGDAAVDIRQAQTRVELRGSSSMLPAAQLVAERYMADHPEAIVLVSAGGSARGFKSMAIGTTDMAMAPSSIPEDVETIALERNVKFSRTDIYQDALVPVVHVKNKLSDISFWKLRDVFRGAITNWKELGGKDAPITVMSPFGTSGTYETFKLSVLHEDAVVTPKAKMMQYLDMVKALTEDENGIGYVGMHGVRDTMRAITVDGVSASEDTVRSGKYPIRRTMSLYTREPANAAAKGVLEYFLAPDKGQAYVRKAGDVPLH